MLFRSLIAGCKEIWGFIIDEKTNKSLSYTDESGKTHKVVIKDGEILIDGKKPTKKQLDDFAEYIQDETDDQKDNK